MFAKPYSNQIYILGFKTHHNQCCVFLLPQNFLVWTNLVVVFIVTQI